LVSDTWNPDDLASWGDYQERSAGLAFVKGVDAVVGLLVPDMFQSLVFARDHRRVGNDVRIYAFGSRNQIVGGGR
jgi:hypothetical protein